MKEFWNERYNSDSFAYGKEPNTFFKQELDKLEKGKILIPADGEGRNSVYAAKNAWDVYACDISSSGKAKAMALAAESRVEIQYLVGDFGDLIYEDTYFDAVSLIYAHFPSEKKRVYHQLVDKYLKVGGTVILEAFSKDHLNYNSDNPKVGGPKNRDMLYSVAEVEADFPNYEFVILEENQIELNEGQFHIGRGSVVRFVGKKVSE